MCWWTAPIALAKESAERAARGRDADRAAVRRVVAGREARRGVRAALRFVRGRFVDFVRFLVATDPPGRLAHLPG